MKYANKARLLSAGVALFAFSAPAYALDGNSLIAKLNSALLVQGGSGLSAESVTVSGTTVTAAKAKFTSAGGKQSLPLGNIVFEGVEEDAGSYTVETVKFDNVNVTEDKATVTASDISISGLYVPADPNGATLDAVLLYDEVHIGKVAVAVDGKPAFSIDETTVSTEVADDSSSIDFDMEVNGIKGDLSLVDDPKGKDALQQLGITAIDGKMTMQGSWTLADGTLDIDEYAIDFAKIGRLNVSFSIAGYTLDFVKSLNETIKAQEVAGSSPDAQQAAGIAMLGLLQQLTFNSAEIRFEDAGITTKALDYAGKQQGVTGKQLADQLKAMTPLMLAQFNVPELQNMLSAAVNAYLDKPGSFTITAEPKQAVPVPMIMGAAMGAPNTLPEVLGVKVTAND